MEGRVRISRLVGALKLVRAWNLVLLGSIQYIITIGLIYGVHRTPSAFVSSKLFFVTLTTALIGAAGYTLHDYLNTKRISFQKPHRHIVGRVLTRREAILMYFVFSCLAIICAGVFGWRLLVITPIGLAVLWVYSSRLQHMPIVSAFVMAAMAASIVYIPFWSLSFPSGDAIIFAVYGAIMVVIRQMIKELRDINVDIRQGVSSFPIIHGIKRTKQVIALLFALFCIVLYSLSAFLATEVAWYFLALLPLLCLIIYRTIKADNTKKYQLSLTLIKGFIVVGALGSLLSGI